MNVGALVPSTGRAGCDSLVEPGRVCNECNGTLAASRKRKRRKREGRNP
jgi:hypothetical protein